MGGDHAPAHVIDGAFQALRSGTHPMRVLLVGRREALEAELERYRQPHPPWEIVHASQVVEMGEAPNEALKSKKDSSISVGLHLVRDRKAGAFVSAGNTGAVLSASTLILGRLPGVGRPTIGTLFPTAGSPCLMVDAGASVDCRPRHLFEFGAMGAAYMTTVQGLARPRIGLLNIGEEEGKGNEATQEAYKLFRASTLEFVGNIEGRDILRGIGRRGRLRRVRRKRHPEVRREHPGILEGPFYGIRTAKHHRPADRARCTLGTPLGAARS